MADINASVCTRCGALVPDEAMEFHENWHKTLGPWGF